MSGHDEPPSDPARELDALIEENERLRQALAEMNLAFSAHSIVAVTDRRGVILEANDRFVEISKYSRDELVGQSHSLVNSGYHPPEFFRELWRTISGGEICTGEICNRAKDGSEYWVDTTIVPLPDDANRPERYIAVRSDVTQRHHAEERVRRLAYSDPLTGLPNRTAVLEALETCMSTSGPGHCGFIAVALDDLSTVNDAFGYATGDRLLLHAASRLSELGNPVQFIARIDSTMFGVMLRGLGEHRDAAEERLASLAECVLEALSGTVSLGHGVEIQATATAGYVLYRPGVDGIEAGEVVKSAEIARKRAARQNGLQRMYAFEPAMIAEAQERVKLIHDLRRGIAAGDLRLFLQPIVDRDRRAVAYEGLLRWQDAERGLVGPAGFIPLAERTGMIVEMGAWVLDEACRVLSSWSEDPRTRDLVLSVNLSERQLRPDGFVDSVRSAVQRHGAPSDRLRLEVTESMLHTDLQRTVGILHALKAEHVKVALDDFGTGYSSLSYLKQLPVQQLKIDRSFVARIIDDPDEAAIVQAIVGLARIMGLQVVAEGVETEEQFELLQLLGADAFQGFLFGRPAPIEHTDPLTLLP